MILVVDIGNSNVVIGGVEGEKIFFEARLRTESTKTSDEYTIDLKSIPEMVLRGKSSINMEETDLKATYGNDPNAPLFVLDGFEVSIQKEGHSGRSHRSPSNRSLPC